MEATRWQQVKSVFAAALACEPRERPALLERECGADTELRREVESLLSSHDHAPSFLEEPEPAVQSIAFDQSPEPELIIGAKVGAYELVRKLGAGGMGAVYLAGRADGEFQKQVAIKLIRRGMESDFAVRRFRNERQILARLEHPNIARFLDGGTTADGMPFFIMEYIEGEPITTYCDFHRLTIADRLPIFVNICSAVQYAHERKVVHRDLKPTNILVTNNAVPKLLDFGIAKLLDAGIADNILETTLAGLRLMTPAYASPEQMRGEPATVRSDVYSLGVVMYETLCGRRPESPVFSDPYDSSHRTITGPPSEVLWHGAEAGALSVEQVSQARGVTPQELRNQLSGNVDHIVLKAIHQNPQDRYESVEAMAADIERHLAGEPVSASRPVTVVQPNGTRRSSGPIELAVLPFGTFAADESTDGFFGAALADALITRLSNVKRISVRPTSSVLRTSRTDPIEAGRELNVQFVVAGHIRKDGNRVRVTVQLVSVPNKAPVWAGQFDERADDLLRLEDSLSAQLAAALLPQFTNDERRQLEKRGTESSRAFQSYLKGRWHWNTGGEEDLAKALVHFMEAIAEDPKYALAHAGVADYYIRLGIQGGVPSSESFAAAKYYATRAIEIDESLAEAHAALGFAFWAFDHDLVGAMRQCAIAIGLNPDCTNAHHWLGLLLASSCRSHEALASLRRARMCDPFSPAVTSGLALCLYYAREYEAAIDELGTADLQRTLGASGCEVLARCYLAMGNAAEALVWSRHAVDLSKNGVHALTIHTHALVANGASKQACDVLERCSQRAEQEYVLPGLLASMQLAVGNKRECLELLERGVLERDWWVTWVGADPLFEPLHADERYQAVLRQLGIETAGLAPRRFNTPVTAFVPERPARRRFLLLSGIAAAAVVVALSAWFAMRSLHTPAVPFQHASIVRLTTSGNATHAFISGDGKYVVYALEEGGKQALWIRNIRAPGAARIMPPMSGDIDDLALSADDAYASFTVYNRSDPNRRTLYEIPVFGGSPKVVASHVFSAISFSPDRTKLAAIRAKPSAGLDEMVLSNVDGSGEKVVATRRHPDRFSLISTPAWSSDGTRIASGIEGSDSMGFHAGVISVDAATGKTHVLHTPRWHLIEHLAWMPDGRNLLVVGENKGSPFRAIWFVPYSGGAASLVTNDLSDYSEISVTSDAHALVSVRYEVMNNMYRLSKDSKTPVQITSGSSRYYDLAEAPSKIVYASDATGNGELWTIDADGSASRQLTAGAGRNYAPDVSPDGKFAAFHSDRTGAWNLFTLDLTNGSSRQLTFGSRDSNWPTYSPDGKWLYYHHTGNDTLRNIWRIPASGGTPTQLTYRLAMRPAISNKDGRIACWYSADMTTPHWVLAILSPEGGEPVRSFEISPTVSTDSEIRWTPDGQGLTFQDTLKGVSNIWVQPVLGGPAKAWTDFTSGQIYSFDWTSDGRLLYSRGLTTSDVVLLQDTRAKS